VDVPWTNLRRVSTSCVLAGLLCTVLMSNDPGEQIADEALRLVALRAIFPEMHISLDRGKTINDSWPKKPKAGELFFPDALAGENVYRVVGAAMNEAEREASENIVTERLSNIRRVRCRVFRWPKEGDTAMLAVLQYNFPGSRPAMSCPSIGALVHIVRNGLNWIVKEEYLLETVHHNSLQGVRLLDLTGEGANQLVVESNWGGAGTIGSTLYVFDLRQGRLDEVLETESRRQSMNDDLSMQTLQASRTRQSRGQRFCFSKTTLVEEGKAFHPPRITVPCYRRGEGVDSARVTERNKILTNSR